MLSYVNPKIEVRGAGSKGCGLFAREFIAKNEIAVIQGGRIVKSEDVRKPPYNQFENICFEIEKGFEICPPEPDMSKRDGIFLLNHSCEPNCGLKGQLSLVAMRDIQPDEEITCDYAMLDNGPQEPMECFCGFPSCRKVITGDDWRRKDLQEKYNGYFSLYLQKMIYALNQQDY